MTRRSIFVVLVIFIAGCAEPKNSVWYNPQKNVEQAEKDMKQCYLDAFIAKQEIEAPHGRTEQENDPRKLIESLAADCMKEAGYHRQAPDKLSPEVNIKSGVAHTMPYSIAGKQADNTANPTE
ncbi:MAG: hypothetical protein JW720_01025 [Sedimentisphaerales bacterium]|nr:hypothetical protein [Sedimentisphaerales bacterium]